MKNKYLKNERLSYIFGLSFLIIMTLVGFTDKVYSFLVFSPMKDYCVNYLDSASAESAKLFMGISVAKGAVAVIEGSSMSVNFIAGMDVEVGDIVQPIHDAIDIVWDASLMSVVSIQIQRIFFELFQMNLLRYLLLISLLFYLISILTIRFVPLGSKICFNVSRYTVLLAFCVYFLFPVGVLATSAVSGYLDQHHKNPAYERLNNEFVELENFSRTLETLGGEDRQEAQQEDQSSWYEFHKIANKVGLQWADFKKMITSLPTKLKQSSGLIFECIVKIVTIYIIEVIILPILFILLFWSFLRMVVGAKLDDKQRKYFSPYLRRRL